MKLDRIENMKGGWFVGNFEPSCYQTPNFEVSYKVHAQNEHWPTHYHTEVTEINLLVRGTMILQGKTLVAGDIFKLEPYEIADPVFITECEIVCVKTGSINDKISVVNAN